MKSHLFSLLSLAATLPHAGAVVIWSENFTGQTTGADRNPSTDFPGGAAGNDWTITNNNDSSAATDLITNIYVSSIGATQPSMGIYDTRTNDAAGNALARVNFNHFAMFNTATVGQQIFRFGFDYRVENFSGVVLSPQSNPRISIVPQGAGANALTFGFGLGDVTTATSGNELFLYAGTAISPVPASSTVIGYSGGPAGTFATGFDFGTHNTSVPGGTTPGNAANDTNDEAYRFLMNYVPTTGALTGTVTRISTGEQATFSRTFTPITGISDTDGSYFEISSGQGAESQTYWDNFQFEVVPEPSAAGLLALGSAALLGRRRRQA